MRPRTRLLVFGFGAAGTAALFTAGTLGLPGFGGSVHPYADRAVAQAVRQGTPTPSPRSPSTSARSTPSGRS